MSIFFVLSMAEQTVNLEAKIDAICDEHSKFGIKDGSWLLSFDGTTHLLAERLGIRAGETEPALVLLISNYSGRASPDIWEWLSTRMPMRVG